MDIKTIIYEILITETYAESEHYTEIQQDQVRVKCRFLADKIASQLEPPVIKKNAEFTSSELLMKMNEIIEEYPHQGNFAEDGRYTYPDRWN